MFYCYLAGYISGNKLQECTEWRKKIREYYNNWKGKETYPISWLDPLNGELEKMSADGLSCSLPGKALVHRDHSSVRISNLIIANLDTFGEQRPLTGTVYELAWAWMYKTPVIVISTEKHYVKHPFIIDTASIIVSSVDELLEDKYINYIYKGLVTANY